MSAPRKFDEETLGRPADARNRRSGGVRHPSRTRRGNGRIRRIPRHPAPNSPSAAHATPTTVSIPGPAGGVVAPSAAPPPDPFGPLDLRPGNCYNSVPLPPDGSTVRIASVEAVPCSEPRTAQVVATFAYPKNTSNEATESRLDNNCGQSFTNRLTRRSATTTTTGRVTSTPTAPSSCSRASAPPASLTDAPTTGSALKG
jgi:hypothetical protein